MKDYIEERAREIAEYIVTNKVTVRKAAKVFNISKSTVHKDITERLRKTEPILADKISEILSQNKAVRHIRGGQATKEKYMKKRLLKDSYI